LLKYIAKTHTVQEQHLTVLFEPLSFPDLPERGLGLQFLQRLIRESEFTPFSLQQSLLVILPAVSLHASLGIEIY